MSEMTPTAQGALNYYLLITVNDNMKCTTLCHSISNTSLVPKVLGQ